MTREQKEQCRAHRRAEKAQRYQDALALMVQSILTHRRPGDRITDAKIAQRVGVSRRTIIRWKHRPEWQAQARQAQEHQYRRRAHFQRTFARYPFRGRTLEDGGSISIAGSDGEERDGIEAYTGAKMAQTARQRHTLNFLLSDEVAPLTGLT